MDTSLARPEGGYLAPLLPEVWFGDAPNLLTWLAVQDQPFDAARQFLEAFHQSKLIRSAVGADLDRIGAFVDIVRNPGEGDDAYRTRIPATVQHGLSASTIPDMEALLTSAFHVPNSVVDGVVPGTFTVTLYSAISHAASVMPLVRHVKAAGTLPTGRILLPSPTGRRGRVGESRLATSVAGGNSIFVPLT